MSNIDNQTFPYNLETVRLLLPSDKDSTVTLAVKSTAIATVIPVAVLLTGEFAVKTLWATAKLMHRAATSLYSFLSFGMRISYHEAEKAFYHRFKKQVTPLESISMKQIETLRPTIDFLRQYKSPEIDKVVAEFDLYTDRNFFPKISKAIDQAIYQADSLENLPEQLKRVPFFIKWAELTKSIKKLKRDLSSDTKKLIDVVFTKSFEDKLTSPSTIAGHLEKALEDLAIQNPNFKVFKTKAFSNKKVLNEAFRSRKDFDLFQKELLDNHSEELQEYTLEDRIKWIEGKIQTWLEDNSETLAKKHLPDIYSKLGFAIVSEQSIPALDQQDEDTKRAVVSDLYRMDFKLNGVSYSVPVSSDSEPEKVKQAEINYPSLEKAIKEAVRSQLDNSLSTPESMEDLARNEWHKKILYFMHQGLAAQFRHPLLFSFMSQRLNICDAETLDREKFQHQRTGSLEATISGNLMKLTMKKKSGLQSISGYSSVNLIPNELTIVVDFTKNTIVSKIESEGFSELTQDEYEKIDPAE
jgi:hypothetical protein